MELKPGYKQTEVGVIPEDWEVQPLSNLTNQVIDGTHHTPKYTNSGIPFLRVTDIQSPEIDFSDLKFISQEEHQVLKRRCNPMKGDLLLSKNGTIGISKIITWDWEFSIFVSLALLKLQSKKINVNYLDQFFKSDYLNEQIRHRSKQGTVTNLHLEEIREFLIPLPSIKAEQTAIANVLGDADALIQSLTRLIAKKRQIKQAAMQTLLNPYESGRLKTGWVVKSLGEICDVRDGTHDSPKYLDSGVKFVTSKNIVNNKLDLSEISYISQMDAHEINKRSKVDHGDILMSMIGTIGNAVLVDYEPDFCIKNIALLKTKNVNAEFLIQYIGFIEFQALLNESLDGGIQKFISLGKLRALQIRIPFDKCEQTRIATILSDMDAEIAALEAKLAKYRHIKQGMMQNLLTGRIRLI